MPESIDPITRQIIQNALASAADEMAMALYRTAYSTIVRDCLDYSTSLCDAKGDMIAQGVTIPLHLGAVPFAMATLIPRFEGFDKSIEEASADLGENMWWTFWRVTFPMVFPGIVASLLLCFTISFDEFIMAFFLSGTDPTLPLFMWGQLRFPAKLPGVLALGSLILAVSFFVVFFSQWVRTRGMKSFTPSGE